MDSQAVEHLLMRGNTGSGVWADAAYRSEEMATKLRDQKLKSHIHRKGKRGNPLTEQAKSSNRTKSTERVRVEHVFGAQTNDMGGTLVRTIGLVRAKARIGVQGSLWTLPVEMRLYLVAALLGMLGLFRRPLLLVPGCGFGLLAISQISDADFTGAHALRSLWYPGLPFFCGMGLYLLRARLPSSPIIAVALIGLASLSISGPCGYLTMALATSYATLWLAGIETGALRGWNRMGDYSYGKCVYAFPVQGMVAAVMGDMDPITNIAISAPITLALAALSWHFLERPAMHAFRKRRISAPISPSNAS